MENLTVLSHLALIAFPFLIGIVAWFAQRSIELETKTRDQQAKAFREELSTEIASREQQARDFYAAMAKEAGVRAVEIARTEQTITTLNKELIALQREVDKEYVNFERLEQIVRPLRESIDGMRQDVRDVFEKLDTKQDRNDRRGP